MAVTTGVSPCQRQQWHTTMQPLSREDVNNLKLIHHYSIFIGQKVSLLHDDGTSKTLRKFYLRTLYLRKVFAVKLYETYALYSFLYNFSPHKLQNRVFYLFCLCFTYQCGEDVMIILSHHSHGKSLNDEGEDLVNPDLTKRQLNKTRLVSHYAKCCKTLKLKGVT